MQAASQPCMIHAVSHKKAQRHLFNPRLHTGCIVSSTMQKKYRFHEAYIRREAGQRKLSNCSLNGIRDYFWYFDLRLQRLVFLEGIFPLQEIVSE